MRVTQSCSARVDTAMSSISPPTPRAATSPPRIRAYKRGALFANPCYTQIHPTCIPVSGDYQSKLTLMSESLRNDGRVWVPKRKEDCSKPPHEIPEEARDYYLERKYPSYGNLAPRDISSRSAKEACDEGRGVGPGGLGVYLDFADAIKRLGRSVVEERYSNLFEMYENITGENAYERPMRIYPAVHYTMGGSWVDYNLMSNVPGLHVLGEANFSDHGANRLGASALMQGLADGYFVIPYTIGSYLAGAVRQKASPDQRSRIPANGKGGRANACSVCSTSMEPALSTVSIASSACSCGTNAAWRATRRASRKPSRGCPKLREEFWSNVKVLGAGENINQSLEKAGRVADFLEFGELMCRDALDRNESCGGHFRVEYQTPDGEALRDDENYAHVSAWKYEGAGKEPTRIKEPLVYETRETGDEKL